MAELTFTPVDHDPFAAPAATGPKLTPVDHDPFAPKPGVVEDVAKTVPSGLARGVAGVVGLPGALGWVADQVAAQTVGRVDNYVRNGDWSAPDVSDVKARSEAVKPALGFRLPGAEEVLTSQNVTGAIESVTGPLYKPQTAIGEFANTAAEFAPGIIFSAGTLPQRLAQTFVPAVTSEGAGQVARQVAPDYENVARLVGGVTGAVGTAVAQIPRGANVVMSDALRGVTQQEWDDAARLMQQASSLPGGGVNLTWNEALNQATGGRLKNLTQLDRVVTNSGGQGGETMGAFYAQRPDQIARTGAAQLDNLAPAPYDAGQAAQRGVDAAEGALRTVRGERSAITAPFYANAANDAVPAADVQSVIQRLDDIIANAPTPELGEAARQLRGQLILRPATPGAPAARTPVVDPRTGRIIRYDTTPAVPGTPEVPRTNVAELDQVYGQARDDFLGPPVVGETGSAARARQSAGHAVTPLNDALLNASPNLQQGRAAHQQVTNNLVRPVEQGPIGRVANIDPGSQNASAQMGRELASPGVDRYHGVVQQAVRRMVRQDPRAAETLARDYVGDVLNQATRDLQGGANVYGGANFFKKIAGDDASLRNLEAMVTQLPMGQQRWGGFRNFLDAMQATGYKAVKGSDTAFNQATQQQLREGGLIGKALETAAGAGAGGAVGGGVGGAGGAVIAARRALSDRLANWRMANGGEQIAWMLTSPEAAPLLRRLSQVQPGSSQAIGLSLRLSYIAERATNTTSPAPQPVR